MTHRAMLLENLAQLAAARRDYLDASSALRAHLLSAGPLVVGGAIDEQLPSQLRGLAAIFDRLDRDTETAIATIDGINQARGRAEAAGHTLPPFPAGLGPATP